MPRLAEIWRTVSEPFREFGAVAGALYAADRVLRRISPRLGLYVYEMMVQPVSSRGLLPPQRVRNIVFEEIGRGHPDLARMPALEKIRTLRFEQGACCLGAYRKGVLLGYCWFCFGTYAEDEVRCNYHLAEAACSVFDFDFYIFPEHRMGIAFPAIWHGANLYLAERGIRHTFSRMTRFNSASRRAHAHLGARQVGQTVFLKAGKIELMLATLPPFVALTWRDDQRVDLRLSARAAGATPGEAPMAVTADEAVSRRHN